MFFASYCLKAHLHHSSRIKSHKEVTIKVFLTIFAWWWKDPWFGSIALTERPKNLRIRIRNTGTFSTLPLQFIIIARNFFLPAWSEGIEKELTVSSEWIPCSFSHMSLRLGRVTVNASRPSIFRIEIALFPRRIAIHEREYLSIMLSACV